MAHEHKFIEFRTLLEELRDICVAQKTGTAFIVTENSQLAEFRIEDGKISGIQFRDKRGIEALRLFKQVEKAKYSFNQDELAKREDTTDDLGQTYLPSTFHVFQLLGMDSTAAAPLKSMPTMAVAPKTSSVTANSTRKKVLVVEDSAVSRRVIVRALAEKGYEITETEDGFQALAALGNSIPDLVLLDLVLPGIDGYKVLAHMKKRPECANIPVIILTSRDTLLDKLRGKMSEADEYLTKPFPPSDLLEKVEKHLG